MKGHLGYSEDEMKLFRENPRNEDVLSRVPDLMSKTIIGEVVESHGCNSQHRVGDRFYFVGARNLLTKACPRKVCVNALNAATRLVCAANELAYAVVAPNEMRFKRAGCLDVCVRCGGWGRVIIELKVVDREKVQQPAEAEPQQRIAVDDEWSSNEEDDDMANLVMVGQGALGAGVFSMGVAALLFVWVHWEKKE